MLKNRLNSNDFKNIYNDFSGHNKSAKMNEMEEKVFNGRKSIEKDKAYSYRDELKSRYITKLEQGKIDKFTGMDILMFFIDLMSDNGYRYISVSEQKVISNIKTIMKKGVTVEEILVAFEFLVTSEQTYISKESLTPNILNTGWLNKILEDSKKWLNDEYIEESKLNKNAEREWNGKKEDNDDTVIGEWGI